MKNEIIILVHGFNKNKKDMSFLQKYFNNLNYETVTLSLPTIFSSLEHCTDLFEEKLFKIQNIKNNRYSKIHFVGHSFGGLIIRKFLSRHFIKNIGRCVLIATPNQGSQLADITNNYFSFSLNIVKSLKSMLIQNLNISSPINESIEIGVIAGNKCNLLLGHLFLPKNNDGRVEINSTKIDNMKDYIILEYGHKEIHHKLKTANYIKSFLQKGEFIQDYNK